MRRDRARAATHSEYRIYVIELDAAAWEKEPRIRRRNPDHKPEKPVVYVGYTSGTPEERLEKHRSGRRASPFVRDYAVRLRPRLYQRWPVATSVDEAHSLEEKRATSLRKRGYAVWEGRLGALDLPSSAAVVGSIGLDSGT